jgi:hypothetical protein
MACRILLGEPALDRFCLAITLPDEVDITPV